MKTNTNDEGIQHVRDVRSKISAEYGNDPKKIVEHYLAEQARYQHRLLTTPTTQKTGETDQPPE